MSEGAARVTVIIPVYNRQETIGRAIKSVLDQSHRNLQLIVVDDGSTDQTYDVIRAFDDSRLLVIRHRRNRGAAAARNTGLRRTRSDYVAFLDSDDEWLPGKIEQQIRLMDRLGPAFSLCFTAGVLRTNGTEKRAVVGSPPRDLTRYFQVDNRFIFTSLLFRHQCLERGGLFNEAFRGRGMEDLEWLRRVAPLGRLAYLTEPLVLKYEDEAQEPHLREEHTEILLKQLRDDLEQVGSSYRRRTEALWLTRLARVYCRQGNLARGLAVMGRAVRSSPPTSVPNLLMFSAELMQRYFRLPTLRFGREIRDWMLRGRRAAYWVTK